jgi:hypothetical protein
VCIEKKQNDYFFQKFNSKGIFNHEIVLKTEVTRINNKDISDSFTFYTDDSLYSIKRKVFTAE